jgi:hypothetical protein
MAAPIVVVQGLPPAPALRAAVLSACSDALKHRSCVAHDEQDQADPAPAAAALIAWPDGTDRHVHVTLDRFDASTSRRIERDTRFANEDPIVERWRTIGLVIAALVGESDAPRDGAETDRAAWSSFSAAPASRAVAWVGLSALVGPGLDDGSMRFGGALHGAVALRSSPIFLLASVSHALRPVGEGTVDVRWTTFAVGSGARALVPSVNLALRARFEILLEYLRATGASGGAVSGGGNRLSPGIRAGGEMVWPSSGPLAMALGFSVWSLPGGTAIQLDQQKLGSSQWLSYAGFLGAEWFFR